MAFAYDESLTEVNFRQDLNRLTEIGVGAFEITGLSSVMLPDSVETIGQDAFSRNRAFDVYSPRKSPCFC